jgi:hypothetical protein
MNKTCFHEVLMIGPATADVWGMHQKWQVALNSAFSSTRSPLPIHFAGHKLFDALARKDGWHPDHESLNLQIMKRGFGNLVLFGMFNAIMRIGLARQFLTDCESKEAVLKPDTSRWWEQERTLITRETILDHFKSAIVIPGIQNEMNAEASEAESVFSDNAQTVASSAKVGNKPGSSAEGTSQIATSKPQTTSVRVDSSDPKGPTPVVLKPASEKQQRMNSAANVPIINVGKLVNPITGKKYIGEGGTPTSETFYHKIAEARAEYSRDTATCSVNSAVWQVVESSIGKVR